MPLDQPPIAAAREAGVPIIGEIELASRWLSGRIVAITGTKGKSTTTTLDGPHVRRGRSAGPLVGGNIGTPLSSQVAASTPETFHIVEVSSFQLETTETFHPWIAVLLNLSSDHLDRHGSMEAYGAAKARIFANQTADDWAVINADDPQTLALARAGRARKVFFSVDTPLVPLSSIRLIGRHLVADVMAAAAVAQIAGVPHDAMVRAVESFTGLEHALEPVAVVDGVRFVNDSKATNVEAAQARDRELRDRARRDHGRPLQERRFLAAARAAAVAGRDGRRDRRSDAADSSERSREPCPSKRRRRWRRRCGARSSWRARGSGGVVLLAPACASFDMFRDYAERGQVFKKEVHEAGGGDATRER